MALHTEADGRINAQTALVDLDKRVAALEAERQPAQSQPAEAPAIAKGWKPTPPKPTVTDRVNSMLHDVAAHKA